MLTEPEKRKAEVFRQMGFTPDQALSVLRPAHKVESPALSNTVGAQIAEAAASGVQQTKEGIARLTSPEHTSDVVTGATKAGAGIINTLSAPLTPLFSPIGKVIGYVTDKLSDTALFREAAPQTEGSPLEKTLDFASDLGTIAGAATITKLAPKAAAVARDGIGDSIASAASTVDDVASTAVRSTPFLAPKTPVMYNQQALKAAAELLQSGSKKSAKGRAAEFNNADIQAMEVIRDSLRPITTQQQLATFFDDAVSVYTKNREDILKPKLAQHVSDTYQSLLRQEARRLLKAKDQKSASTYTNVLNKEREIFTSLGKQSPAGKNTVAHLVERIKDLNLKVQQLYDDVGGKQNLLPEQKAQAQAYDLLREGLKQELDAIGGETYATLGKKVSGLIDAREFARIQRDRVKNALTDTPWETMNLKERALFLKDVIPTIKDFGVSKLIKLDTKADVLDALVESKIRQIRDYGAKSLESQRIPKGQ